MRNFIVAEISKNWDCSQYLGIPPQLLSGAFEDVIEVNRARGYELHSFQLHRLMTSETTMNETIIAVFKLTTVAGIARQLMERGK